MYCRKCGKEIMDDAVVCVHCGCSTKDTPAGQEDAPNAGLAVLGFLIPIVGLILWLFYKDTKPLMAKSAGKGALISVIISFTIFLLLFLIGFSTALADGFYY